MPTNVSFKKVLFGFFVIALVIRLIFIFAKDQPPVMWDARIYSSCAIGLLDYVENGGTFGHPENDRKADSLLHKAEFLTAVHKHIRGEWIEWLYYSPPSMAEAQEYIFLSGPVYPIMLAAIFAVDVGTDFVVVRVINCIIDSLSMVLLMLGAYRLFGRKEALLAGAIYIIYLPFILQCGVLTPDILTTFLILVTLNSILNYYEGRRSIHIYLSGVCPGLLALNKPTATLLFVPFLAGFLYDERANIKKGMTAILKAAGPLALIVVPWVVISTSYYGELSVRDPQYSDANFRSSSSIKYEGYDLDYTEPDFWTYPVSNAIMDDTFGYAHLLGKKFNRLWQKPYNDFKESFVIGPDITRGLHFIIVVAGLFGVFYCLIERRRGILFLFLIPAYYTLVHIVFHSLPRYNLNAMPVMIVAAAVILCGIYEFLQERMTPKINKKLMSNAIMIGAGLVLAFVLPVSWGGTLWGGKAGALAVMAIKAGLLCGALLGLYRIIRGGFGRKRALRLVVWPGLILMGGLLVAASATDGWAEWRIRLDHPEKKAGVKIYIADKFRLEPGELFRIGLDITATRDKNNLFYVTLNGEKVGFTAGEKPLTDYYYPKFGYTVFERMLDIRREEMRAWSFISMDPLAFNYMLDRDGYIWVELASSDTLTKEGGYIDLYGAYQSTSDGFWYGPGTSYSAAERLLEKGDPRIWQKYKLSSDSVISYYIDKRTGTRAMREDLSDAFGRQGVRYNIIIEVKRLDKNRYYF
jgi:4-amino-4-deoxy-L-arabinose transferase-like glycosyltransferase